MNTTLKSAKKKNLERDPHYYQRTLKRVLKQKEYDLKVLCQRKVEVFGKMVEWHPFYNRFPTFYEYSYKVRRLTELQPLHLLENIENRGINGYDLDHIVPVEFGYKHKMPPESIADIKNLQVLQYWVNNAKGRRLYCVIEACNHLKNLHNVCTDR